MGSFASERPTLDDRIVSVELDVVNGTLGYFLRWQIAAFSAGAAAIHFAEISTHYEEFWVFGAFFLVVAWFQAVSSVAIVARSDRRLIVSVVAVNLVVIGVWIWSRTAGLPIGPNAGEAEAIGAVDVLATVLETLLVVWAVALPMPAIGSRAASRGLGILSTTVVWAGIVAATALVFFTATPETAMH